jgi:hypothetical protein
MPAEHHLDPAALEAVTAALARSRTAALEASQELLAHYSDTGDAPTQLALNAMLDHAAGALRALTDLLAATSVELESWV